MYNQGVAHDNDVALFQVNTFTVFDCPMFSLGSVSTACLQRDVTDCQESQSARCSMVNYECVLGFKFQWHYWLSVDQEVYAEKYAYVYEYVAYEGWIILILRYDIILC